MKHQPSEPENTTRTTIFAMVFAALIGGLAYTAIPIGAWLR